MYEVHSDQPMPSLPLRAAFVQLYPWGQMRSGQHIVVPDRRLAESARISFIRWRARDPSRAKLRTIRDPQPDGTVRIFMFNPQEPVV